MSYDINEQPASPLLQASSDLLFYINLKLSPEISLGVFLPCQNKSKEGRDLAAFLLKSP